MSNRTRRSAVIALSLLAVLIGGCTATTVQIVRAPLISPVVVPAPQVFLMNVSVKNFSDAANSPDLWLQIYSEYWPVAQPAPNQPPCAQNEWLHVGVLTPGQSWARADYRIDRQSNCPCVKDACPGHVWLSLHVAEGYAPHIAGPNTALHVSWVPSGNLGQMTISEF